MHFSHAATFRRHFLQLAMGILLTLAAPPLSNAETVSADAILLSVITPDGSSHDISEGSFSALPQATVTTETAWTQGKQRFDGVLLREVLKYVGVDEGEAKEKTLTFAALNEYSINVPAEDAFKWDTLVARKQNGELMARRDKGPLWLVYPRDDHRELRDQRYDQRWAWQLRRITIK